MSPVAVSFRTGHMRCRARAPGREAEWQCQEGEWLGHGPQVVLPLPKSPTGKCLTWVGHWAANWKNLMSLHSTPSMDTEGDRGVSGAAGLPAGPPTWASAPTLPVPLSMVCCCLAEQMSRLMPSMTWLLESTSFSRGFLLRKMVGTAKWAAWPCYLWG